MKPGDRAGRFEIESVLGMGGMGAIYRARDASTGEVVSLKTVHGARQAQLDSIWREIRTLNAVDHPSVPRFVEHGIKDQVPWFAMEFIEGESLDQFIRSGIKTQTVGADTRELRISTDETAPLSDDLRTTTEMSVEMSPAERDAILRALAWVCRGLAHVHGTGIVHRDIKPGNIIVRPDGTAAIVDFGSASQSRTGNRDRLTDGLITVGTPAFMSPEQVQKFRLDPRADLYSIGCILFYAVTGRRPFEGANSLEVARKHVQEPPPPLDVDIPAELSRLIVSLLAKDPKDRPGYADDVAAVIERAVGMAPPRTPGPAYLFRPDFVGREALIERTDSLLADLRAGKGGLMIVHGPSGMGKTRAAVEVINRARTHGDVDTFFSETRLQRGEVGDLVPLKRVMVELASLCRSKGRRFTQKALGSHGRVLARLFPPFGELPGMEEAPPLENLPPALEVWRTTRAFFEVLSNVSDGRPVLVVLDEIAELAVPYLSAFLDFHDSMKVPIALVCTCDDRSHKVIDSFESHAVQLAPLTPEDVDGMVRSMVLSDAFPDRFLDAMRARSDGRPMVVSEHLATAVREGVLYRTELSRWAIADDWRERWQEVSDADAYARLLNRRLRGLDAAGLEILQIVSVWGIAAPFSTLVAFIDERDVVPLDELIRQQVLELADDEVVFTQSEFRNLVYESMPVDRRRHLHAKVAQMLESEGDETVEDLGSRAFHLREAGLRVEARDVYRKAAQFAFERLRLREAAHFLDAYFELETRVDVERLRNVMLYCEAQQRIGNIGAGLLMLERWLDKLPPELGYTAEATELHLSRAFYMHELGRAEEALPLATAAAENAEKLGLPEILASASNTLGTIHWELGDEELALAHLNRSASLAQTGYRRAIAAINRGALLVQMQRFDEARKVLKEARAATIEASRPDLEGYVWGNLAIIEAEHGNAELALEYVDHAIDKHRSSFDRFAEGRGLAVKSSVLTDLRRHREAAEVARDSIAMFTRLGWPPTGFVARVAHAAALLPLGKHEEASAELDRVIDANTISPIRAEAFTLAIRLRRRLGQIEEAARIVDRARRWMDEVDLGAHHAFPIWCESTLLQIARGDELELDARINELEAHHALRRTSEKALEVVVLTRDAQKRGESLRYGEPRHLALSDWVWLRAYD